MYADNLSKELARIPAVKNEADFWAFAAAGALEAAIFKQYNTLVTLSPQLLTDCDKNSNACDGGIGVFGI
jgi:hypothetical protein